ncbi:acetylornithine aminotransferase [Austwickia chelonae]|uniref:Acetylornithine aminotransferase n=2 Tax=Austwickia TaxID=1184606 RepID=K6W3Q0_9MICO|nr:acetylornithine aminotransferase [Austwickia chelonae NBRC 105200]SEW24749.1 acetylornithine aminotransferase [Austwickia chelonae]
MEQGIREEFLRRYGQSLLPVFGQPQLVVSHGIGSRLWDVDGREYLDLLAGIAVNALGHSHPALVRALSEQASKVIHVSNYFTSPAQVELAEKILRVAEAPEGSAVFFTNSGTESVEAAIKLSRRTGRIRMVAAEGAFHGRSTGALSLTHRRDYREPFEPLLGEVCHVPFDDAQALRAVFADDSAPVAALFLEPIQGEAGVIPASHSYLRLARELCTRHGALLVFDEVQSGIGRTGRWFAHQWAEVVPDVMTLAKGLGGGVPIGAMLTFGRSVTDLLSQGQHGTTFGGNPLACAAGAAVIEFLEQEGVLERVRLLGDELRKQLIAVASSRVVEVRGQGLLLGIGLRDPEARELADALLAEGIIVNAPNPYTLRIVPSLLLKRDEADLFVEVFGRVLRQDVFR